MDEVLSAVIEVTAVECGADMEDIPPSTPLRRGELIQPDDLVEIIFELETELGVEIPEEALESMKTLGDLAQFIREALDEE